jgi:hypothetical protein
MSGQHKICPKCRRPAPVDAPSCAGCGRVYRTTNPHASQAPPAPRPVHFPQPTPAPADAQQQPWINWGAVPGAFLFLVIILWSRGCFNSSPPPARTVEYQVTGQSVRRANLTYENGQGGTEQSTVELPWSRTLTLTGGQWVYLSATSDTENAGSITVRILVDGREWKSSQGEGAFCSATASGNVPVGDR